MNTFFYLIIFILGCFFGSFFTLAVYRIPRKEDILIKHSYCPNCNHKLGFLDLFPIFSYLFLRRKCRYCHNKIRPRYFILELFSGIVFLLIAISFKIDLYSFNINIVNLFVYYLYISILFILAGIDKENIKIERPVLVLGFLFEIIYIIYKCTLGNFDVYRYVILFIALIILLILSIIDLKRNMKVRYCLQILFLSLYIIIFNGGINYAITVLLTLLTIAFYSVGKKKDKKLPIGFFLCVNNIITILFTNFILNYFL